MPSSVTHSYFGNDVYDKLPKEVKSSVKDKLSLYKVFAQGPDPYFFYDFHLTIKSRKVFEIDKMMHHEKINEHFITLINYINDKNYYSNKEVMSYLYGQICHYVLDTMIHPYTVYYTGIYNKKDKNSYKYNGLHEEMEYYIDCYLIYEREHILPKDYKVYKEIFKDISFGNEVKDVIDYVGKDVYGIKNNGNIYKKAIKDMKWFYLVFNYDRFGIKKFIYSLMDLVCGNLFVKKKELSFHISPYKKIYYLNNEKEEWNHPCDKEEKYNYSFTELYVKAIDRGVKVISEVDKMLRDKKIDNKKLEKLFGNLDYGNGKDCNGNYISRYFRF